MRKLIQRTLVLVALMTCVPLSAATPFDFYTGLLRRGVAEVEAGRAAEAVTPLRLAAFGLVDSIADYETALAYLVVAHDRLKQPDRVRDAARRIVAAERIERRFATLTFPPAIRTALDGALRRALTPTEVAALNAPAAPSTTRPAPQTQQSATTTPAPTTTNPSTTRPAPQTQQPATTTPAPTTTVPSTTRPAPQTQQPATTTPAPTTTNPSTTRPAPQTQQPATTTPAPTTTNPSTTRPEPQTQQPATTTPAPTTTNPSTTRPAPQTQQPAQQQATPRPQTQTQPPTQQQTRPATPPPARPAVDIPVRLAAAERALIAANLVEARRIYRELLDVREVDHASMIRVAEGLYRSRDFANALVAFQRAGALRPGEEAYRYYIAVALYETGQYARARQELAAALPYIELTADVQRYRAKIEAAR